MASNSRRGSNGHGTVAGALTVDTAAVRARADQIAFSADTLARITDQVAEGAESQDRSLESAVAEIAEMTASLAETATQAESVTVVG